jgi:hypothetical protein
MWNSAHLVSFSDNIDNRPATFALLDMMKGKYRRFSPAQTATNQNCQQRAVAHAFERFYIRRIKPSLSIFFRQPIAGSSAAKRNAFNGTNPVAIFESSKALSSASEASFLIADNF